MHAVALTDPVIFSASGFCPFWTIVSFPVPVFAFPAHPFTAISRLSGIFARSSHGEPSTILPSV